MSKGVLFPGERQVAGPHYPVLAWHRPGDAAKPLLVLVPGGGHLARVYYGHPDGKPSDFLAHWLGELGYELLALSYPSGHSVNRADCADMTIVQWAEDLAAVAAQHAIPGRELVLVAWSMAGRLARLFRLAALRHGFVCDRLVSLTATPPLPNLTSPQPLGEPLTASGLWDSEARGSQWCAAIMGRRQPCGRLPIDPDTYARDYRCDNPIGLRGEPRDASPAALSLQGLADMLGMFDYADYPLCACVVPDRPSDARHALTDRVTWSFLNAQMLYCEAQRRLPNGVAALRVDEWRTLRRLTATLPDRLVREIDGDHFFFIGEDGARAAARHVHDLIAEMEEARAWRAGLPPTGTGAVP